MFDEQKYVRNIQNFRNKLCLLRETQHLNYFTLSEAQSHEARKSFDSGGDSASLVDGSLILQDPNSPPPIGTNDLSEFAKDKLHVFQQQLSQLLFRFRKDIFHRPERPKLKDVCARYEREASDDKIFKANIWKDYVELNPGFDIVVVTQMHEGKLKALSKFLQHWTGGFSVALYLNMTSAHTLPDILRMEYPAILERRNIDIHITAKEGVIACFCTLVLRR